MNKPASPRHGPCIYVGASAITLSKAGAAAHLLGKGRVLCSRCILPTRDEVGDGENVPDAKAFEVIRTDETLAHGESKELMRDAAQVGVPPVFVHADHSSRVARQTLVAVENWRLVSQDGEPYAWASASLPWSQWTQRCRTEPGAWRL